MSALTFASARLCAAASASKPLPCTASRATVRPERGSPPADLAHGPHRLDEHRLARRSTRSAARRSSPDRRDRSSRAAPSATSRRAEQHREVAGDGARDAVVERRGPAVELVELDAVRRDLHHELAAGRPTRGRRPARRRRRSARPARRPPSPSSRGCRSATAPSARSPSRPAATSAIESRCAIRLAITSPPRSCRE